MSSTSTGKPTALRLVRAWLASQDTSLPSDLTVLDRVALLIHATLVTRGFQTTSGDSTSSGPPADWRLLKDQLYRFQYISSGRQFEVKIAVVDGQLAVLAAPNQDSQSLAVWNFPVSSMEAALEAISSASDEDDRELNDHITALLKTLPDRMGPEGPPPSKSGPSTASASTTARPRGSAQAQGPSPARTPPFPSGPSFRPSVGAADLDPLAASPLAFPSSRIQPHPSGPSTGDGSLVGPGHPLFARPGSQGDPTSDIFGGPQPLPRNAVPSGARFDPIGPFGINPSHAPGGLNRGPQCPRPSGPHPWSGEPDNDELPPPITKDGVGSPPD
ncbi:hypothetical protein BJ085DRAFT_27161 [Dimargaris cristalligena]|uniref:PI31 proteasome regulator C-terminal domain-containing protein n=1 Tax=Dimargaris cristalligena TaxID=215637 RepID=A0A4P9ZS13_9FUNG|nr:hypothetical protein BJ085DRAFT_27161 [Dimargaris cristalligena]|eukprot:RKP36185.1 hypothetical protein BJ085DRAFT_27161 [Dimargaris cristalligena]